jgi:hypothetical protein
MQVTKSDRCLYIFSGPDVYWAVCIMKCWETVTFWELSEVAVVKKKKEQEKERHGHRFVQRDLRKNLARRTLCLEMNTSLSLLHLFLFSSSRGRNVLRRGDKLVGPRSLTSFGYRRYGGRSVNLSLSSIYCQGYEWIKVKVTMSLCLIKHHDMKTYGGVDV